MNDRTRAYGDEFACQRAFAALRAEDPVHWSTPADHRPFWAITRHADIMAIEANGASTPAQGSQWPGAALCAIHNPGGINC